MRLIDADALCDDAMERYCKDCDKRKGIKNGKWRIIYEIGDAPCRACDVDDMVNDIESAPTVDAVERKRGRWIDMGDFEQCSACTGTRLKEINTVYGKATWIRTPYCPNCGADMRGEANEQIR